MAVGFNAFATGSNTTALGTNSAATASGATAVGQNAQATFAGSAAFGSGASATAANQQSFGTATSTYAFPGITSAASAAAQIGTTQLVTTDSAGRLASDGGATASAIATAQTTANTAQTTANTAQTTATAAQTTANTALTTANTALAAASGFQNQINDLYNHERKLMQGIAMAAAVPQSIVLPGENFSLSIEWANYGPANAVGLSSAVRLGAFAMGGAKVGVQGNVGVGIGVDGGSQTVTRAGVRLGW